MDFVSDALFNGKKFRALTLVDNHTRECLAIAVGQSLTGSCVVEALSDVIASGRQLPQRIQTDNGPEFISVALDKWAYDNNVVLDFLRDQASQPITLFLNHLMEASGTSV